MTKSVESLLGCRPAFLQTLNELLKLHGFAAVAPLEGRKNLHPFMIPLAKKQVEKQQGERVIGLLLTPCVGSSPSAAARKDQAAGVSVVMTQLSEDSSQQAMARQLQLVSKSVGHLCHRIAATADAKMLGTLSPFPFAGLNEWNSEEHSLKTIETANKTESEVYSVGKAASAAKDTKLLCQFLARSVAPFPDICERLVQHHLLVAKNPTSALVAAEWAADSNHGWARGYWYLSQLMSSLNRPDEARDAARAALLQPLYTLGAPLDKVLSCAGFTSLSAWEEACQKNSTILNNAAAAAMGQGDELSSARTPQEEALETAKKLLNRAVMEGESNLKKTANNNNNKISIEHEDIGWASWEGRKELADLLKSAGDEVAAKLVLETE